MSAPGVTHILAIVKQPAPVGDTAATPRSGSDAVGLMTDASADPASAPAAASAAATMAERALFAMEIRTIRSPWSAANNLHADGRQPETARETESPQRESSACTAMFR